MDRTWEETEKRRDYTNSNRTTTIYRNNSSPKILVDGLLVRKKLPGEHPEMKELRPCIAQSLQKRIILQMHKQGGHIRLHKLFHLLLQRYWMPTPTKIIMATIANCLTCPKKTLSVGHSLKAQQ